MNSLYARFIAAAIVVTASLTACAGKVLPQHSLLTAAQEAATSSPCDIKKVWDLHGACVKYSMQKKGTTVALTSYHGIALTMVWPSPMPPQPDTFISGDADGNGDITGTYKGTRFPKYGSVKCIDPYFHPITCPGKAFLYSVTINATSFEIGFHTSPKIKITNKGSYPGTKCIIANLEHLKMWAWQILDMPYAKPVGGALTMKHGPPLTFSSGGGYDFAYVCK